MKTIRAAWGDTNFGDILTPVVLSHFTGKTVERAELHESGKILLIGSLLEFAKPGDIILGTGTHATIPPHDLDGVDIRGLRGPKTAEYFGVKTDVYGDPAILLPFIYKSKIKPTKPVGYVPVINDRNSLIENNEWKENYIDIITHDDGWKDFIDKLHEYERIETTTLHTKIVCDAYGIPCDFTAPTSYDGGQFKYEDYLLGMPDGIEHAQRTLIKELKKL